MVYKAPNSNEAICVVNNMHLTTKGAQQFLMAAIQPASCRKVDLPEMRDNNMKTIKVSVDGNNLQPQKEWGLYAQQFR